MSERNQEDQPSTSQAKRRRIADDEEQPNQLAIVGTANEENEETRPKIFKLIDDCVLKMFDWLSIQDIFSVGETCTRMQRIAGDYFKPNLAALQLRYDGDKLQRLFGFDNMDEFKGLVRELQIGESVNNDGYRFIGLHCKSLKHIKFMYSKLDAVKIEHIKPILSKVESVIFFDAHVLVEFYEGFLKFCPNLKRLGLHDISSKMIIGTDNSWMLQSYPMLEHLELNFSYLFKIDELGTFFDRNASLHKFTMNWEPFLENIDTMIDSNIKLQELALSGISGDSETIYRHLLQLHASGFYQNLHLRMDYPQFQQLFDQFTSLDGVEKLYLELRSSKELKLNSLENVKELVLSGKHFSFEETFTSEFLIDLQATAKSLVNLERLYTHHLKPEFIEPFIQYSPKLKVIKFDYFGGDDFINFSTWNEKREKLVGARKVSIYLKQNRYLATIWGNKTTDSNMVEVKREESIDWKTPFTI